MNFTLKQLRYAEAAGRLGSIARAAEEMAISQSSITAAIDALEQSLDYDLFVRTPARGIQATPAGMEALQMIRTFLNNARHFESDLQAVGGDETGVVRIGCYGTAAPAFLPPILKAMKERRPTTTVDVLEGDMASVIGYLRDGKSDLSFTYEIGLDSGHSFERLFSAPPYALLPADDPLCALPGVSYAQLSRRPMVMLDLAYSREYFNTLFARRGLTPNVTHATQSADFARALVAGGFGFTILNILPPGSEGHRSYKALPILDETEAPVFGIATLRQTRQPRAVRGFIRTCIELRDAGAFDALTVSVPGSSSAKKNNNSPQ
ncbi:MAG: LysR family transcriptional regulator [Pseudooceanicola sp.]|nr:LysR family transcriptional regulator [Pseudooceanicola sp.]